MRASVAEMILNAVLIPIFAFVWIIGLIFSWIFKFIGDILMNAYLRFVNYFGKVIFGIVLFIGSGLFIQYFMQ